MKQATLEQKMAVEFMRMTLHEHYAHKIAIKAKEEPQAFRGRIARHESAYSSDCGTLTMEREMQASGSTTILGEGERLRVEQREAIAVDAQIV